MTVGTKRETCCLLNQFIFAKNSFNEANWGLLHRWYIWCPMSNFDRTVPTLSLGQYPIVCTTDDFKSVPLNGSVGCCNGRCTSKIRVTDKNAEAKEMDRTIQVTGFQALFWGLETFSAFDCKKEFPLDTNQKDLPSNFDSVTSANVCLEW